MADPKRPAAAPHSQGKNKKKRIWLRVLAWTMSILLVLGLAGVGVIAYAYSTIEVPDPNSDFQTNTSFVYYADGKSKIGSFQVQNRQSITYEEMPQYVKDAVVAAENRTFWEDPGISVTGLFRAALGLVGISTGGTESGGGSTITQQYIKIMYLTQEKSFTRKAKEILLAAKIGQELTKEEILERYLNTVYFGRGAYGIQAAAQAYFNKSAAKLTLAESVALAAILNSPGNLDPANGDAEAADLLERYQYTLNGMVELGMITEAQKAEIYRTLPEFPEPKTNSQMGGTKGFLLSLVQKELLRAGFSEEEISGRGLKIVTTFDKAAQAAAVDAAKETALQAAGGDKKAAAKLHPALASIDNATGGVVALYGGPDYVKSQWNWATNPRPTGSTFKPYALAAALRNEWTLNDKLNGNTFTPDGDSRPVRNAGGANYGRITLQQATTKSVNTAYTDLVSQIENGPQEVVTAATDAGLPESTDWDPSNRIPLGRTEVSPLNQASAYSTFANQGVHRTPHVVAEVFDVQGRSIYAADTNGSQTIETDVAIDVTYALTKVTQDGTGYRASQLGYEVAGKTGTYYVADGGRSETRAVWFVGFTRQLTTAVMYVKGDQGTTDLGSGWFGSGWPLTTWLAYMRTAMDGKEHEGFDPPTVRVSTQTPTAKPSKTAEPATENPLPTETVPTEPVPTVTVPGEPTVPQPTQPTQPTETASVPSGQPTVTEGAQAAVDPGAQTVAAGP
ncbi:MAG TPA: transglycosylase domain-containing protein [Propionicimonas sp.]|nr:transglycosylase domain-containing protein [Propionicimonas sp.]HQA77441.1 transglycosylase domain-containing protein [Propionicimonas sp.]